MESTTKTTQPVKHQFNSNNEITKDPYFIAFLQKNISELRKKRYNRPTPKPGYHYKRDWYDRMSAEGQFDPGFFIKNIESIWLKKSSLSSEVRNIVQFVCEKSLQQTLQRYANEKEAAVVE